jgi:hypothetical protein
MVRQVVRNLRNRPIHLHFTKDLDRAAAYYTFAGIQALHERPGGQSLAIVFDQGDCEYCPNASKYRSILFHKEGGNQWSRNIRRPRQLSDSLQP